MVHSTIVPAFDVHVHRLFARYAGMPVGVVTQCAANHAALLHDSWRPEPGRSHDELAHALFERCDDYVFELLHGAATREQRRQACLHEQTWSHLMAAGPRVLDFGGGLGLSSSLLATTGKQVTYCDVDGPAARFAAWLFAQDGQRIEVLRTAVECAELPRGRQWDVVLAEHVLEFVAEPVTMANALAAAVAPGGLLLLVLDAEPRAAAPLARPVDRDALLRAPALAAMERVALPDARQLLFRARGSAVGQSG
jgi:SAM-dependent methyltransferase